MLFSSSYNSKTRSKPKREGFTLVELLMVIMIIGLLTTFVLVAMAGATRTAKENRTTAQIAKIHELLMDKYASYQYRRMPPSNLNVARAQRGLFNPGSNPSTNQPIKSYEEWMTVVGFKVVARDRLTATREMMRLELPCTKAEVVDPNNPAAKIKESLLFEPLNPHPKNRLVPALSRAYYQRALAATGGSLNVWTAGVNESAECLYLILSQLRDGDASALEFFSENEIGDTDGDGMKEVLDGWGQPIAFQRWAPGFGVSIGMVGTTSPLQRPLEEAPEQEDMFDPMRVGLSYQTGYPTNYPRTLVPLIISAGPDGKYGINVMDGGLDQVGNSGDGWIAVNSDPYVDQNIYRQLGTPTDDGTRASDNITNHSLSTR